LLHLFIYDYYAFIGLYYNVFGGISLNISYALCTKQDLVFFDYGITKLSAVSSDTQVKYDRDE